MLTVQRFETVSLHDAPGRMARRLLVLREGVPTAPMYVDAVVTCLRFDRPPQHATAADPARRTGTVYGGDDLPVPLHAGDGAERPGRRVIRVDDAVLPGARRLAATRLPGRHVYAGEWKLHFGHFLLESLCRAWAFADRSAGAKLIFHGGASAQSRQVNPVFLDLLAPLGVGPEDLLIADRDLRVDELVVPESLYDLPVRAHRGFVEPFARIAGAYRAPAGTTPRRLYFSRRPTTAAMLARQGKVAQPPVVRGKLLAKAADNEEEAEQAFAARGFAVVTPEALPLARQVALAAGAEAIAGLTGSALHHALFCTPPTRIVSVATRLSPNQIAIEQACGLQGDHLFCTHPGAPDAPVRIDVAHLHALLDRIGLG